MSSTTKDNMDMLYIVQGLNIFKYFSCIKLFKVFQNRRAIQSQYIFEIFDRIKLVSHLVGFKFGQLRVTQVKQKEF